MSAVAIRLIVAVTVVIAVILAIAGYIIKQMKKNSDGHSTLDTAIEYDVNIYPESNRTMANRGNFNPADLLHFDSPADKFSRPSSATYENVASPSGFQKNVRSKSSRQTLWRQMILNLLIEKSS